ncbi:MAG: pyridoxamine 5'-phosphate oxidase family protein [Desulfobacterales bacterium]|nr:pyridoxamine 5'-phosphate oxidase family protein [Desulfobacterales bacterium]
MRRKDKEITDKTIIDSIINKASVCRLALSDENIPYIVPLSFGYKDNALYFHSAPQGKKIDILKKNNKVCFEFDISNDIVKDEIACKWGMKYFSIIGFGKAEFIDDLELKQNALNIIMEHYSNQSFTYLDDIVEKIAIIKVDIENISGKKSGY